MGLVKGDLTTQCKEAQPFTTEGVAFCSHPIQTPFQCQPPLTLSTYTEYVMTPGTACVMDARILFPEDYSLFIMWQRKLRPESGIGQIHDALEYDLFIKHREVLISSATSPSITYQSHLERNCGHTHHPSDSILNELCPVCEVGVHLSFLNTLALAWNKSGGVRLRPQYERTVSLRYRKFRKGWHIARLQLQELLEMFVVMATYEEAWEATHPAEAGAARKTNSASAALKLAQEDCMYPARLSQSVEQTKKQTLAQDAKKKVNFSRHVRIKHNDTISKAITKFTPDRPRYLFSRSSPAYEPGVYACPTGSEFIDTSHAVFTIATDFGNLKVYVTDDEEAFDLLQANPQYFKDSVGECQGIVDLHDSKIQIYQDIINDMAEDSNQEDSIVYLLREADRMVVLIDDDMGGVVDTFLFDGSDRGDLDDAKSSRKEELAARKEDWTCLRKCLQ
jgi:hypothetical protein